MVGKTAGGRPRNYWCGRDSSAKTDGGDLGACPRMAQSVVKYRQ
jgi:hypothetical protein